ncbi:MAG TPA: CPBP family intramembrane glutamic endopeptidase [Steroidobacteraceae bacterium]|nr:CPBP family intramembrane glutamic endopeptidase [Steroidobacteraceae bacterium]
MSRNQSLVGTLTPFVLLIVASLVIAAALTPLVQQGLAGVRLFPLHRVFNRIAMIVFLIGTWLMFRREGLANREALGYGVEPRKFCGSLAMGLIVGVALMLAVCVLLTALQVRMVRPEYSGSLSAVLRAVPSALLAGFAVGLIEETFFRGAMFGALSRQGRWISAVVLTSVLYSLVHFLGEKVRIVPEDVNWLSGWVILGRYFSAFGDPGRIFDAALALFLVGVLLALVRRASGHIGGCIGLHAGFVAVIALFRELTLPLSDGSWSFLVSRFDGLVGYLVATLAALCCAGFYLLRGEELRRGAADR